MAQFREISPCPPEHFRKASNSLRPSHSARVQNGHVESFNGRFRDECLSQAHFPTLDRARVEIELWRVEYNCEGPHSSLRYETP